MKITIFIILSLFFVSSLSADYDPKLSEELWKASSAAYSERKDLAGMNCGQACDHLKGYKFNHQFTSKISDDESVSYSVFVNPKDNKVVFAFRGTAGDKQLTQEMINGGATKYDLHNIPNAVATGYFYDKYKNNLRKDFMNQVEKIHKEYPKSDFYFTGHSLGGALTTLGALDASMSSHIPKSKVHLYTYGQPRVGDINLGKAVEHHVSEYYRVTHHKDVVPHVPPCITDWHGGCADGKGHGKEDGHLPLFWHAYHAGKEVFYNDDKHPHQYKVCTKHEDPTCSKQYGLMHLSKKSFDDHGVYLGSSTETHAHHNKHLFGHHDPSKVHHIIHTLNHHPAHHNSTHHHTPGHHVPTHHHNSTHHHTPGHHVPTHHHNSTHHHTPGHHVPTHHHNSTHHHTPAHHTPGHHVPTHHHNSTHHHTPAHHTPAHHVPTHGHNTTHHTPAHHHTPTHTPVHHTPTHHTPTHHTPAHGHDSTHHTPTHTPVHHTPTHTPVHHNPTPVHHTPVHHTPTHTPVHHTPAPVHHKPAPVHHTPAPVHHTPAPVHHKPAPVHHTPAPVHHTPAPVHHTPAPVHHAPAPVHHTPAPVHHTPAPVHHTPAPVHHTPAPVHHTPAPVHHPTNLRPIRH